MNNSNAYGSVWRKWDLHFHTPSPYDYAYGGATNEEIVGGLINERRTLIQSTTIENLELRAKLLALESGEEAFLKQEHRYGMKQDN